jgi:hypothetical protein
MRKSRSATPLGIARDSHMNRHRWALVAFVAIGVSFVAVRASLCSETAAILARITALMECTYGMEGCSMAR